MHDGADVGVGAGDEGTDEEVVAAPPIEAVAHRVAVGETNPPQAAEQGGGVGLEDPLPVDGVVAVLARFGQLFTGLAPRQGDIGADFLHQRRREMLDRHRGQGASGSNRAQLPLRRCVHVT